MSESPESTTPAPRTIKQRMTAILSVLVSLYIVYAIGAAIMQDRLVFPRHFAGPGADPIHADVEQLWLPIGDAGRVEAWLLVGEGRSQESPGPAVMFLHGNGETIDEVFDSFRFYATRGITLLVPEYRGYGRSDGKPSQKAIVEDSARFFDLLAERPEVDPDRIFFHGRSIGGGVACALAREREPAAMILESTFTNVASMSWRFGVPPFLCRHPFRNDRTLRSLDAPVLLMHGTGDLLIPPTHSERLHGIARRSSLSLMDGGHNDFPVDRSAYLGEIERFLESAGLAPADQ